MPQGARLEPREAYITPGCGIDVLAGGRGAGREERVLEGTFIVCGRNGRGAERVRVFEQNSRTLSALSSAHEGQGSQTR